MDDIDRKILGVLQQDATLPLEKIGALSGISRNACWRRIKQLEATGVITKQVAVLDADRLGVPLKVMILIRTTQHRMNWAEQLEQVTAAMPEIQAVYRMTGELDYLIEARVADMAGYDYLYRRLISKIDFSDVSASFVMEVIKETTELPILP